MSRKDNALAALQRDGHLCLWCLWVLRIFNPTEAPPHHLFGKRYDSPEYQISLCMTRRDGSLGCHQRYHNATLDQNSQTEITRAKLVDLAKEHIWKGKDMTPPEFTPKVVSNYALER